MYKLYGVKKWGSLGPQCILEEVGAPYEMVWLSAEDRRGAYRKINPLGYVPSLQLADGRFVFESSAIVTHITDAHPSALAKLRFERSWVRRASSWFSSSLASPCSWSRLRC